MKSRLVVVFLLAAVLPCVSFCQAQWNGFDPQQASQTPLSLRVSDGDLSSVLGTFTSLAHTLQLLPNATNYVYLDLGQTPPVLVQNTTGFPGGAIYKIAIATTNATRIISVTDSRPADMPMTLEFGIVNGSTAGTVNLQAKSNGAGTITFEAGASCAVN
jgi:hypothetical protein